MRYPVVTLLGLSGCPWIAAERHDELTQDPDTEAERPACETLVLYADADGDGWGSDAVDACNPPTQTSEQPGDCDDEQASIHPGAAEVCDGIDNDCSPGTSEAGTALLIEQDGSQQFDATPLMHSGQAWEISSAWSDARLDLCEGTFQSTVIAQRDDLRVEVRGLGDVTVTAPPNDRTFYFNGSDATLTNLTLVGDERTDYGAVVLCANSQLTMTDVTVSGGTAPQGGGLYGFTCDADLTNTSFVMPSGSEGTALYLLADSTVVMQGGHIDAGGNDSAVVLWESTLQMSQAWFAYSSAVGIDILSSGLFIGNNVDFPTPVGPDVRVGSRQHDLGLSFTGRCGTSCVFE